MYITVFQFLNLLCFIFHLISVYINVKKISAHCLIVVLKLHINGQSQSLRITLRQNKQILLCLWMINIQFVLMQMYLCNLYRKLEQLLKGSQLQNAEIQSAALDNCSCSTISPFQNGKIWNKICISLHYVLEWHIIIKLQDKLLE